MSTRICEICGKRPAKYVCQRCGALACEYDFDLSSGFCINCVKEMGIETYPKFLGSTAFIILMLGIALTIIGFILMASSSFLYPPLNFTGGGLIIIGPIPFVFGFGEKIWPLIWILIALIFIFILIELFFFKKVLR